MKRNGAHGILLFTGAQTNAVRSNKLKENEPFDLMATPPVEIANTFELNECKKSSPPGLCDCG